MRLAVHAGMRVHDRSLFAQIAGGETLMRMHLQFGFGMMDHCRVLLSGWRGGTAILSPRDLKDDQLRRLASDIRGIDNCDVLLDPQFYLPDADHERLCSHSYWPTEYRSGEFWTGAELERMLKGIIQLNQELSCSAVILPGRLAEHVNEDWIADQRQVFDLARSLAPSGTRLLATVALGADALRNDDEIHELLDDASDWNVQGIYLVAEHPGGAYLVNDANWLVNLLDIAAGFRLKGLRVIVGYCNQQSLALACAAADAISSGTWMNVRSFPPSKFKAQYDEEIRQRTTWYYCPPALSEYKATFLDIAHRQGVLDEMRADASLASNFSEQIFSGPRPTATNFTEQAAFRHFLHCLHGQVAESRKATFDETMDHHRRVLDRAETLLNRLRSAGVYGQGRDFTEALDINRAALQVLAQSRGIVLRRAWARLLVG